MERGRALGPAARPHRAEATCHGGLPAPPVALHHQHRLCSRLQHPDPPSTWASTVLNNKNIQERACRASSMRLCPMASLVPDPNPFPAASAPRGSVPITPQHCLLEGAKVSAGTVAAPRCCLATVPRDQAALQEALSTPVSPCVASPLLSTRNCPPGFPLGTVTLSGAGKMAFCHPRWTQGTGHTRIQEVRGREEPCTLGTWRAQG